MMKRRLPRVLGIIGVLVMLAASCAPAAPAPTAAPAKPAATTAPAPAAAPTTAPAAQPTAAPKPAATTAPAAAKPTTAPAAAAKPTGAPIKVGHVTALSGGSAALGQDQLRGSQLAAKEINAAGGLLGRPLEIVDRDDKFAPQEAAKQTELLILNEKVDVLVGCVSAATALAMNEVAKRANAVLLATCQSNNLNKKPDFGPYTFHMALSPWMNNQAALPWITQNLGKKIFVLLADYTWGHENNDSIEKWLQVNNIQKAGAIKTPIGTPDYTPLIPQIIAAKPEVLYVIMPGADSGNFLKQARPFGIFNQMKIFAPVVDAILDREPGFSIIEGQYGAMNFYWELQDKIPSTRKFVDAYAAEFKFPPSGYAAYSYAAIRSWADAVTKAGSVEPAKVVPALEGLNFDYAYGKSFVRKCDHQLFQPIHIAKGRSEAAGKAIKPWPDWAFREVLGSVEASEKNERTCAELGL